LLEDVEVVRRDNFAGVVLADLSNHFLLAARLATLSTCLIATGVGTVVDHEQPGPGFSGDLASGSYLHQILANNH